MPLLALALCTLVSAQAQNLPDPVLELRRQEEREQAQRQEQERSPQVRLPTPATSVSQALVQGESPCFKIKQIELQGLGPAPGAQTAPLPLPAQFDWLPAAVVDGVAGDSPIGLCLGAQGINQVLQRAQDALIARGYVTSRVLAAPQDLGRGRLVLSVVPGRIRAIRWATPVAAAGAPDANDATESAASMSRARLLGSFSLQAGDLLNLRAIEQALENLKRVPSADADIQIEPADEPGQSDLVVRYQQAFPLRLSLSLDDSGTKGTGKYQGNMTVSYDNALGLNDLLYLTLSRDLGGGDPGKRGTRGNTVHYSLPWGYWSLGVSASQSRYFQNVAGASQDYLYRGSSRNADVKLSRLLWRNSQRKTSASIKAWRRQSNNYIDDTEIEVQRRVVGGWELGLEHKEYIGAATLDTRLSYKRGTGAFGSIAAVEEAFGEGSSRFALISADTNLSLPFKLAAQPLRYSAQWRIQSQRTPLTPQDRFAIGGRYSVRGFDGESSLSAERGWLLRNELSAPLGASGQELYVGLDHGSVGGPSAQNLVGRRLSGAVLGWRGAFKGLQYDAFIGRPIKKPEFFRSANYTFGFSLYYSF